MSFDIALSGIQAINEQLDTISNNIANAGTYGFKSSRANFADLYAGSQPTGTEIGSTTQSMGLSGGVLSTGRALDAAINGNGFFVSKSPQGQTSYSRVGIFDVDTNGYVVDSAGNRVQGNPITPPATQPGNLGDLPIATGQIPAVASTKLDYVGNLSGDWTAPTVTPFVAPDATQTPPIQADPNTYNMSKVSVIYDSLGAQHTLTQYFVKTTAGVDVYGSFDGSDMNGGSPVASLAFDTNGQLVPPNPPSTLTVIPMPTVSPLNANPITLNIDYSGTTAFAGEATTSTNTADGYASGTYSGLQLGADGSLIAQYSNGQKQTVGMVAVATFANTDGLTPVSDTSWIASQASGVANVSNPGVGQAGALTTSSLEQSNVDITSELVNLMTSQRNYQANSKVIQTESTMLQSLMQAL